MQLGLSGSFRLLVCFPALHPPRGLVHRPLLPPQVSRGCWHGHGVVRGTRYSHENISKQGNCNCCNFSRINIKYKYLLIKPKCAGYSNSLTLSSTFWTWQHLWVISGLICDWNGSQTVLFFGFWFWKKTSFNKNVRLRD